MNGERSIAGVAVTHWLDDNKVAFSSAGLSERIASAPQAARRSMVLGRFTVQDQTPRPRRFKAVTDAGDVSRRWSMLTAAAPSPATMPGNASIRRWDDKAIPPLLPTINIRGIRGASSCV
jgi:hypothetical protein